MYDAADACDLADSDSIRAQRAHSRGEFGIIVASPAEFLALGFPAFEAGADERAAPRAAAEAKRAEAKRKALVDAQQVVAIWTPGRLAAPAHCSARSQTDSSSHAYKTLT
jgi:hypothetical protein